MEPPVEPHGFQAVAFLKYSATPRLAAKPRASLSRRSGSSFAKASEDTHCTFLYGFPAVASCGGG